MATPTTPNQWRDKTADPAARALQRTTELCGPGDAHLILRRVNALIEAGEPAASIAVRLNGPARPARIESELLTSITPPAPDSRSTLSVIRPRPRNDVEAAFQARVQRQMVAHGAKPKTPPAERPPKAEPKKPRPVKKPPVPQRNGDGRHAPRIGTLAAPTRDVDGQKVQTIRCACGNVYERPYRTGRIPGTCETCQ